VTCQLYRHFDAAGDLLYVGIFIERCISLVSARHLSRDKSKPQNEGDIGMSDPNTIALCALDTVISALAVAIWLNSRQWVSREATFGSKLQVDALAAIDETAYKAAE
jgi:hypothetical protein